MKKLIRLGGVIATLLFASTLSAQDFEVGPVILSFDAEPGGIQTKVVTVTNHSNKKQAFLMNLADQVVDENGQKQNLPAGTSPNSCASWITLNPSFFELNPNASQEVEVLMQVPNDGFNTRWCKLFVKATKEQTANKVDKSLSTGVVVNPRIAVSVTQSPKSNTNYRAAMRSFVQKPSGPNGELKFEVSIENIGDKQLKPKVFIEANNVQTASQVRAEPMKTTLMPTEKRKIELVLPNGLPSGTYSVVAILDYGHDSDLEALQLMLEIP